MAGWLKTLLSVFWRTPGSRRTTGSLLASACLHGSVIAGCAFWLLTPNPSARQFAINTAWTRTTLPQVDTLKPLPVTVEPDDQESGGTSLGTALFHPTAGPAGQSESLELASLQLLETAGATSSIVLETQAVGLAGGQGQGERTGTGQGTGTGEGAGAGDGTSFFGNAIEGRRVVYVVDASRSMNHPHPGRMKTRFGRVKAELVRSIGAMTQEQEFFIVYFNDKAFPMPATTLKLAVPSIKQKYLRWAVEARAFGMTDPEQALLVALKLNPDVIYFLTDGAFPPRVVDRVRHANDRPRVTIHTIGFGDDGGERLLKEIAFQNWGTYRFIPATEANTQAAAR